MTFLPLLAVGILMNFVALLFALVAIVLILVILIQKGRGGGLSGAFGGGMASGLLGSKTGDFLTWVTIGLAAVLLTLAVLLARFYRPSVSEYGPEAPAPTSESAPAAPQPAPTTPEQPAPATTEQPAPAAQPPAGQSSATDAGTGQPSQAPGAGGE